MIYKQAAFEQITHNPVLRGVVRTEIEAIKERILTKLLNDEDTQTASNEYQSSKFSLFVTGRPVKWKPFNQGKIRY